MAMLQYKQIVQGTICNTCCNLITSYKCIEELAELSIYFYTLFVISNIRKNIYVYKQLM